MSKTVITSLNKDYFQKSRVFLYPALQIKRGVAVTPIDTYISWIDHYSLEDHKLICLYHIRDDEEFKVFEKNKLLGNKLFDKFIQLENNKGLYVFDFSHMKDDYKVISRGSYSKISHDHKMCIRNYIGLESPNLPYIDSFLYPERHFKLYSELLGVEESHLRRVGELCSKPDMERETLNIFIEDNKTQKENA